MINLVSFCSADGGDGVKIAIDRGGERTTLTVSAEDFLSLGIVKGTVTEEDFFEIERADAIYRAYRALVRMLSYGQCSKKRLYEKLRSRSFSHAAALAAVKKADGRGYIDENRQIESYLRELVCKKFYGRRKILPYLLARGYSGDRINALLDEKYSDSDFAMAKEQFLEKKFGTSTPKTAAEAAEMKKALYKQGF